MPPSVREFLIRGRGFDPRRGHPLRYRWITTSTIAAGRNASTSSTPFHGPPFAGRKSPSPISCAIPIASTAASTATGGAPSHASTAVTPAPITACSSQPPPGDLLVWFSLIVRQRCDVPQPVQEIRYLKRRAASL